MQTLTWQLLPCEIQAIQNKYLLLMLQYRYEVLYLGTDVVRLQHLRNSDYSEQACDQER